MDRQMEGQINGWTDRRIDCQINEWTDSIDINMSVTNPPSFL